MRALALAALLAAPSAAAQELVTVPTRPGVTQSFFIPGMERKPQAIALLYIGGYGNINLRNEGGQVKFGQGNFLPRSRREFMRNGILPVVLDTPSDARNGVGDEYRMGSAEQTADARAVLAELRSRYPGVPVYIATTSRSTLSGAHLARALGGEIAGVVLSSSMFASPHGRWPVITGFDFGAIKTRLLFVHHRNDTCQATPYSVAAGLGEKFPLVSVSGGKPPESGPCDPYSAHGFYGREAETVDAISAWMLNKPFSRSIE